MEYNSHEDYNPIFAIFSRKQKCIYNDCGRSSDLLPYLNAFPASPNPSERGEHRSISTDIKTRRCPVAKVLFNTFSLFLPLLKERVGVRC